MTEGEAIVAFEKLVGMQPTESQKVALMRLQKELGIADDDALWTVFVALEHYETLFERIPEKIATAASFAVEQAQRGLERNTERFRRDLEREVAEVLLEQVERTAVDRAKAARRWATATSAGLLSLLVVVVGAGGYAWGHSTGEQSANSAQLWAQLPNGRYAQKLDEYGVIADLRMCRLSDGDFRIPAKGGVVCETKDRSVHRRGVPKAVLAPE
jgi:hypothetical protein